MPSAPSNGLKAASTFEYKTWDTYVTEAQVEPYPLKVSADETLVIECPTGADIKSYALAQRTGNEDLAMVSLFGEHAERVEQLSAGAPHGALRHLVEDVARHFKIVGEAGEPGESSASSTA